MFITGLILGIILGMIFINFVLEDEKETNVLLKKTINNLKNDLDLANSKIENRDNLISDMQEDKTILLNNSAELRSKITDLEKNIKLLKNNLPKKYKELVDLPNQTSSINHINI